jgi:hypothetical protein
LKEKEEARKRTLSWVSCLSGLGLRKSHPITKWAGLFLRLVCVLYVVGRKRNSDKDGW